MQKCVDNPGYQPRKLCQIWRDFDRQENGSAFFYIGLRHGAFGNEVVLTVRAEN